MNYAKKLLDLYAGLDRACGQYKLEGGGKKKGNKVVGRAYTVLETVSEEKWREHLQGETGLGIVPIRDDGTCSWGCIDVDTYPLDLQALEARCKDLGLPLIPVRSKSGGAHLYTFTDKIPATLMRARLMQFASALGYPGVEIFPKQVQLANERDTGNWINMPYFNAEAGDTDRYAIIGGKAASLAQFVQRAEKLRAMLTEETFESIEVKEESEFADGPPCLQAIAQAGCPEGTRNNGLFALGVYARLKFDDDWKSKLEEYNHRLVQPPLETREVATIEKSLMRKNYFYPCTKAPCVTHCNKELCRGREFGIGENDPDDPGINLGSLVKIKTDPPTWIIDVNGVRMEMATDTLLSQESFRKLCVDRINVMPIRIKPHVWERLIRAKLSNVEEVEAPEDAGVEGRFMQLLEAFCTGQARARAQDELLMGKPWVDRGRVFFRSGDLLGFLTKQSYRELTQREIWAVLRRRGAKHQAFQLKGRCVQTWSVEAFAEQTEDFEVPSDDDR